MLNSPLKNPIQVLLVEDNATDALLVRDELEHATAVVCVLTHSRRLADAKARVAEQSFDIVLLDLTLPDSDGLATYTDLQAVAPGLPMVVLSHRADEAIAMQAVSAGAQDYLVKGQSDGLLLRAIRYALGRMEAKLNLRLSEARWTEALEGVGDGVWDWDMVTEAVFFSRRWKDMLGYAENEIGTTLREWSDRVHPEDRLQVQSNLQDHLDGRSAAYASEHRLLRQDGSYIWVLARGTVFKRDAAGKPLRIVGTHTDISARRKADQQMHLLEASLAHINDVVIITSADPNDTPHPRIVYVNEAFVRHTGYSRAEAIGNTPALLQGPKTQRSELDRIATALKHWQPVQAELINYTKSGVEFWLELAISPLRDATGWVTHWVAVERDMGERQKVSLQMQSMLDALEANQAQLQTLSRRILKAQETERRRVALELHDELGQSLTAVKINLMLPHGAGPGSDEPSALQLENVRIVEGALQQVRRLALALRPSILDDLGLEAALSWLVNSAAGNPGTSMALRCTMARERVAADIEIACFRIVQESLTNIRRHARAKTVLITLVVNDESLDLMVRDDGVGFAMDQPRDRTSEGYSLGLLGIRERALAVGGHVSIVSAPEHGCTVRLTCALDASPNPLL